MILAEEKKRSSKPYRVLWDLEQSPITFDFAYFLVSVECRRQLYGRPSIDLTIKIGGYRQRTQRDLTMPVEEKRWRVKSIVLDLCELLPTLHTVALTHGDRGPYEYPDGGNYYLSRRVTEQFEKGADPLVFRAPAFAAKQMSLPDAYVTMTLRSSRHSMVRNVDLATWHRFYQYLREEGIQVIVIPDYEDVLGPRLYEKYDWSVCVPAALDLRLRMAAYEGARMNICSANGVMETARYSKAPYLFFDMLRGGLFDPQFFKKNAGIEIGQQFPYQLPTQRVTWTDSTYENLVGEWESWARAAISQSD